MLSGCVVGVGGDLQRKHKMTTDLQLGLVGAYLTQTTLHHLFCTIVVLSCKNTCPPAAWPPRRLTKQAVHSISCCVPIRLAKVFSPAAWHRRRPPAPAAGTHHTACRAGEEGSMAPCLHKRYKCTGAPVQGMRSGNRARQDHSQQRGQLLASVQGQA